LVDIKGLGQGEVLDDIREKHKDFMLDFMLKFVRMKEIGVTGNPMDIFLRKFVYEYRHKQLPIGYYRELSKYNAYLVRTNGIDEYEYLKNVAYLDDVCIEKNYFDYIIKLVSLCL
jgi:hypothetical protein